MFFPSYLRSPEFLKMLPLGALLAIALIAALGFHGTDDPLFALWAIPVFILAGVGLWPGLRTGWALPTSVVTVTILLFWGYLAFSTLWSESPLISRIFVISIGLVPVCFLSITMAADPRKSAQLWGGTAYITALGVTAWVLIQFFFFKDLSGKRIHHPMLNPNNLAAVLNMALLPALTAFVVIKDVRKAGIAGAVAFLMLLALMATQSRSCLLFAGIAALILIVLYAKPVFRSMWKIPAFLIACAAAFLITEARTAGQIARGAASLVSGSSPSVVDRVSLWKSTLNMVADNALMGPGLGTFYYFYPAYRVPSERSDGYFAHMDPLQYGAETGVLSMILFYAFMIAVLARTLLAWKGLESKPAARAVMIGAFLALFTLMLGGHVDFHLYMAGILLPAGILLGVWYVATMQAPLLVSRRRMHVPARWPRWAGGALFIIWLGIPALWAARAAADMIFIGRAQAAVDARDYAAYEKALPWIKHFALPENSSAHEVQARYALKRMWSEHETMHPDVLAAYYHEGLAQIKKARQLNSGFTSLLNLEAQFYYIANGRVIEDGAQRSTALLLETIRLNPLASDARRGLAIIYNEQGREKDALDILAEGLKWPRVKGVPDVEYMLITAQQYGRMGDSDAQKKLTQIATDKARAYGLLKE